MAAPGEAPTDELTGEDIESRTECGSAVALVFVGTVPGAFLSRGRLCSMRSKAWVWDFSSKPNTTAPSEGFIKRPHLDQLGPEVRIVRDFEGLDQVGFDAPGPSLPAAPSSGTTRTMRTWGPRPELGRIARSPKPSKSCASWGPGPSLRGRHQAGGRHQGADVCADRRGAGPIHLAPADALGWFTQALDLYGLVPTSDLLHCDPLIGSAPHSAGPATQCIGKRSCRRTPSATDLRDPDRLVSAAQANCRGFASTAGQVNTERVTVLEDALEAVGQAASADRARLLATLTTERFGGDPERRTRLSAEALRCLVVSMTRSCCYGSPRSSTGPSRAAQITQMDPGAVLASR